MSLLLVLSIVFVLAGAIAYAGTWLLLRAMEADGKHPLARTGHVAGYIMCFGGMLVCGAAAIGMVIEVFRRLV